MNQVCNLRDAVGMEPKEEYKHINILLNNIYSNRNIWYDVEDVKG